MNHLTTTTAAKTTLRTRHCCYSCTGENSDFVDDSQEVFVHMPPKNQRPQAEFIVIEPYLHTSNPQHT